MEEKIKKLKEAEKAYQLAMDWYYKENVSKEEYLECIGEYKDYEPREITNIILKLIREL